MQSSFSVFSINKIKTHHNPSSLHLCTVKNFGYVVTVKESNPCRLPPPKSFSVAAIRRAARDGSSFVTDSRSRCSECNEAMQRRKTSKTRGPNNCTELFPNQSHDFVLTELAQRMNQPGVSGKEKLNALHLLATSKPFKCSVRHARITSGIPVPCFFRIRILIVAISWPKTK